MPFKVHGAVAASDLKERGGWGFTAKGNIQSRDGKSSQKVAGNLGTTLYDAEGNILTLDSCVMRGDNPLDTSRPAGLITESNFLCQPGNRALWFNRFYHGADTEDPKGAKAFSQHWLENFGVFDLDDLNPQTREIERARNGAAFDIWRRTRESSLGGTISPPKPAILATPVTLAATPAATPAMAAQKLVTAATPAVCRLQRLAQEANEEVEREEAARKAAAEKNVISGVDIVKAARRLDAAKRAAARKAAQDKAITASKTRVAYFEQLVRESREAYNIEQKAEEDKIAALPAVDRIPCYLQLARDIEATETMAGEKASSEAAGRLTKEEVALLPAVERIQMYARFAREEDAKTPSPHVYTRAEREAYGKLYASEHFGADNLPVQTTINNIADVASSAINTYINAYTLFQGKGEWEEAEETMLTCLHTSIEYIYTAKRKREEAANEADRASKVQKR
ncbi:hypothetical protein V493_00075 [Pseudogymnoascus sp. VKM F-4281 (FW-2241)]|nr:hypothetical protein V493_00075 [Pseudogymnoascus sp. VKM F-4281 (FW-2241)]